MQLDTEQPMPVPNDTASIQEMVRQDLLTREELGRAKYGTALQAHNGRDALRDAYEEALDLCCYLRQALAEREETEPTAAAQRLALAQQALVATGYFTADQVDDDVAPRIIELNSARTQRIAELEAEQPVVDWNKVSIEQLVARDPQGFERALSRMALRAGPRASVPR